MTGPASLVTRAELAYYGVGGGRPLSGEELSRLCESHPELEPVLRQLQYLRIGLGADLESFEPPTLEDYELIDRLGSGGMGVVWAAKDLRLDRVVAIKFLPSSVGPDAVVRERFLTEARTMARVRHHHVVPVHDVIESDDQIALVMELVPGADLHAVLERWSDTDDDATLEGILGDVDDETRSGARDHLLHWGNEVAQALSAAHAAGVLHRDVKPTNIRIRSGDRSAILLDFGVARRLDQTVQTAGFAGTPRFAAPEQLRGEGVSERTDVFGLGRTLEHGFACILGLGSEPGDGRPGGRAAGLRPDLVGRLGQDLEAVLGRALEPDPRDRYASAAAFATDLESARVGAPVEARPRGPMLRFAQGIARDRVRSGLVAVGLLALILGTALWREWPRITVGREIERQERIQAELDQGFRFLLEPAQRDRAASVFASLRTSAPDEVYADLGYVAALALTGRREEARSELGLTEGAPADPPEIAWILDPASAPENLHEIGPFDDPDRQAAFATSLHLIALQTERQVHYRATARAFADLRFVVDDATEQHFASMAYAAARAEATELLDDAVRGLERLWPDSPTANAWIALATENSNPARCLEAIEKASRLDAELGRFLRPLALRVGLQSGDLERAEQEIEAALAESPDDLELMLLRGTAAALGGRTDEARSAYAEVLERDPRHVGAHEAMARLSWRGRSDDLRVHLVALSELRPTVASVWRNLGVHDLKAKEYAEASEALERATHLDPDDGIAMAMFGEAAFQLRDARAEDLLSRASEMLPSSARPHWFLAQIHLRNRKRTESVDALEESLRRIDAGDDSVRRASVEGALSRLRR